MNIVWLCLKFMFINFRFVSVFCYSANNVLLVEEAYNTFILECQQQCKLVPNRATFGRRLLRTFPSCVKKKRRLPGTTDKYQYPYAIFMCSS